MPPSVAATMSYHSRVDIDLLGEPRAFGPTHPGTYLKEEFLEPLALSQNELARRIGVSARTVSDLVRGRRSVTAETALRLGRFFDTTPDFWMNLQKGYDLARAMDALALRLESEITPLQAA